jgi:flagellar motility protein MotE (MotC chaperone)
MRIPVANLHVPMPRLLPITMLVMAALLAVKSVALVRAAAPATTESATPDKSPAPMPAVAPVVPVTNDASAEPATAPAKPVDGRVADAKPADAKPSDAKHAEATAAAVPQPAAPPISDSERALLLDLRKRSDELNTRAAALDEREGVLSAAEARLTTRLAELAGLQKRLESLETERKTRDEANWAGLVKLYESMKPKDAATIFNDLDLPVLLPVVDRMNNRKAALVLAAMTPERARLVTVELAQLRARVNAVPPPMPAGAATGAATTSPGKTAGGG